MNTALIDGPAGKLECMIESPRDGDSGVLAVICHPHPLYAGTMTNKVVTTVARSLQKMGAYTARFNFRGVGKSEGKYDHAVGEVDDLLAVAKWAQDQQPGKTLWLAGFSFGSYIAAKGATILHPKQLITVAPSVDNMDYKSLPPIECPWLVIQGDEDEIVSAESVYEYVESLEPTPTLVKLEGATHFFHGRLLDLEKILIKYLSA